MFRTVTAKLGSMKKAKDFVVQRDQKGHYLVQAKNVIGKFDGKGRGLLNTKGGYFHHLTPFLGAKAYMFPADFVQQCQEIFMLPGETISEKPLVVFAELTTIGDPQVTDMLNNYLVCMNSFLSHEPHGLKQGDMIWDKSAKAYVPFTDQNLEIGIYKRRSDEDFDAFLAEQIAKELEGMNVFDEDHS